MLRIVLVSRTPTREDIFVRRLAVVFLCTVMLCWPTGGTCGEEGALAGMTAAHNRVRAALGLPGLSWSAELADKARDWAEYLAGEKHCRLVHHGPGWPYGENLFWASAVRFSDGSREVQKIGAAHVVAAWAAEGDDYDYATGRCRPGRACGHYTQIVWRDTSRVGCARVVCADKGQVWVCSYEPPGNFIGQKPY